MERTKKSQQTEQKSQVNLKEDGLPSMTLYGFIGTISKHLNSTRSFCYSSCKVYSLLLFSVPHLHRFSLCVPVFRLTIQCNAEDANLPTARLPNATFKDIFLS